jgi:hypothetical protein
MNPKQMFQQMLDFNKTTFETNYGVMVKLQDQMEKMYGVILEKCPMVTDDGKKAMDQWTKAVKSGRENYKVFVEDSFKKMESFCVETPQQTKSTKAPQETKAAAAKTAS